MIEVINRGEIIYEFGRKDRQSYVRKIDNFKPHFFVEDSKGEYRSLFGKRLKKVIVNKPSDVPKEREKYLKHYEADILYPNRYLIDRYDKIEKEEIRICFVDIETESKKQFPNINNPVNKILTITCHDNFDNEYTTFDEEREERMLNKFMDYIQLKDPDMLVAWNGSNFDYPYLIARCEHLGLLINKLARKGFNSYLFKSNWGRVAICEGRILFDLLYAYKNLTQNERESYSLDYVSKYELGEGKEEYEGELEDLYYNDRKKFIEYNRKDVELMIQLNKKLKIIEFMDEIRRYVRCRFDDVYSHSKILDCLMLHECGKRKIILPSYESKEDVGMIKGAFVFQPEGGLYNSIVSADLKSLYPSIIVSCNISPETKLLKEEDDCINIEDKYFYKKKEGVIPFIVNKLFKERETYEKLMVEAEKKYGIESIEAKSYDNLQYAVKVVMNAIYGVMNYPRFRLYDADLASTVTFVARSVIKHSINFLNNEKVNVVYGDTDSVYFKYEYDINKINTLIDKLNNSYSIFTNKYNLKKNIFLIRLDKIYKSIFFTGVKKRYAGRVIWKGEECDYISIMGFENRRSDSPMIVREWQKKVFEMILYEKTSKEVDIFVEKFIEEVKTLREEIGLPATLTKEVTSYKGSPIHVRAARLANQRHDMRFKAGSKFKYVYVNKQPNEFLGFENVIGFDKHLWKGYEVDYSKMTERLIIKKIQTIYESLEWECKFQATKSNGKRIIFQNHKDISTFDDGEVF